MVDLEAIQARSHGRADIPLLIAEIRRLRCECLQLKECLANLYRTEDVTPCGLTGGGTERARVAEEDYRWGAA